VPARLSVLAAVDLGPAVAVGVLAVVLIAAAVTDVRTGLIPNRLTFPAMLFGLVWATIWPWIASASAGAAFGGFGHALFACLVALLVFGIIRIGGGLGWGDVKLMGVVGAVSASWQVVLSTAVYALVIAALIAVYLMIRRGLVKQTLQRIANAAMMSGAKVKPEIPDDAPTVPFAVGVAVGGIVAACEVLLGLNTPWAAW
jgi:prepilin peptidase CpaA